VVKRIFHQNNAYRISDLAQSPIFSRIGVRTTSPRARADGHRGWQRASAGLRPPPERAQPTAWPTLSLEEPPWSRPGLPTADISARASAPTPREGPDAGRWQSGQKRPPRRDEGRPDRACALPARPHHAPDWCHSPHPPARACRRVQRSQRPPGTSRRPSQEPTATTRGGPVTISTGRGRHGRERGAARTACQGLRSAQARKQAPASVRRTEYLQAMRTSHRRPSGGRRGRRWQQRRRRQRPWCARWQWRPWRR